LVDVTMTTFKSI